MSVGSGGLRHLLVAEIRSCKVAVPCWRSQVLKMQALTRAFRAMALVVAGGRLI